MSPEDDELADWFPDFVVFQTQSVKLREPCLCWQVMKISSHAMSKNSHVYI